MGNCIRLLNSIYQADRFIRYALDFEQAEKEHINEYAKYIASAEMQQNNITGRDTLQCMDNRDYFYQTDESRVRLRKVIYNELISLQRLDDDECIKLGNGGALPKSKVVYEKQAYFIIGLPASGKSGIAASIADQYGAIILDSDYAKRKFPEYAIDFGASIVHEESSIVVFGGRGVYANEDSVLQHCVSLGANIVIPKIGDKSEKVYIFSKELAAKGYEVHLILVRLSREKATKRALNRYLTTKRYVPLSLIFDEYSNNPTITFYDLKENVGYSNVFKSYTMLSTDVPMGCKAERLLYDENSPII